MNGEELPTPPLVERTSLPSYISQHCPTSDTVSSIHRYVFDLDGWQIRHPPKGLEKIDKRAAELAEAVKMRARAAMRESQEDAYNAYSG